jgi:sugar phosphate permease
MLLFLEESPDSKQKADVAGDGEGRCPPALGGLLMENILATLANPALWLLGLSLGLLNACRYGFLDWGMTHLLEARSIGIDKAGLNYAVLPIGAVAGSYVAGWATDRFFGGRRAPVICLLLLCLTGFTLVYDTAARGSPAEVILLLMAIGFCIYGPQVLLVGTAPADLARRGTAAAAAGFVNFLGYMGAASGDVVTGHVLARSGWQVAIYVWAGWALAAAVAAGLLWNTVPKK